jgi:hypothetical protein
MACVLSNFFVVQPYVPRVVHQISNLDPHVHRIPLLTVLVGPTLLPMLGDLTWRMVEQRVMHEFLRQAC